MKALIPIGILAAGAVAAGIILRKKPKTTQSATPVDEKIIEPVPNDSFPIKYGSRGEKVWQLQMAMGITPDGIFGTNTLNTLKKKANVSEIRDEKQFAVVLNQVRGITKESDVDSTRMRMSNDIIAKKKNMPFAVMSIAYDTQVSEQKIDKSSPTQNKFVSLGKTEIFKSGMQFRDWSALTTTSKGYLNVRIGSRYFVISPFPIKIN